MVKELMMMMDNQNRGARPCPPRLRRCPVTLAVALVLSMLGDAGAYPPAPHHTIYGVVRDELGHPLVVTNAEILLETTSGVQLKTAVVPNLGPGLNYRLRVPIDAGLTSDKYKPSALQPTVPFRIKVKIGPAVYLPLEMSGGYANLGEAAQSTRLDLTLGADADGDGLPDSWERALVKALGQNLSLGDVRPDDDADHDGLSNLSEYLAGTYAFDPQDCFSLSIAGFNGGLALLEFMAIPGRSYTLLASTDLKLWNVTPFRVPAEGADPPPRDVYQATDARLLRIEALTTPPTAGSRLFFKARVQ